jgi:pimeloyl-ACP methyl ester carboxylesterase
MIGYVANEAFWGSLFLLLSAMLGPVALPLLLGCLGVAFCATWLRLAITRACTKLDALPELLEPALPAFERRTCTSHDGLTLAYHVSRPRANLLTDRARKCVLLCEPLGQSGPLVFAPLLATLGDEYTFVSWDYRGFFGSAGPRRKRRLSISAHAEDGATVLKAAGFESASVCVGHSMGVQVALELTLLWPERVQRLVLLNGCHGAAFSTAFQPVVRLPLLGNATFELVCFLQRRPFLFHAAQPVVAPLLRRVVSPFFVRCFGSPLLRRVLGPNYLYEFWRRYMAGLNPRNGSNLEHFLLSFQEINAHSCFYLLDKIEQPALVVSGLLDPLLPALVSREMAARMRDAEHACDPFSGHTTMLESPAWALHHIRRFLDRTAMPSLDLAGQLNRKSL